MAIGSSWSATAGTGVVKPFGESIFGNAHITAIVKFSTKIMKGYANGVDVTSSDNQGDFSTLATENGTVIIVHPRLLAGKNTVTIDNICAYITEDIGSELKYEIKDNGVRFNEPI